MVPPPTVLPAKELIILAARRVGRSYHNLILVDASPTDDVVSHLSQCRTLLAVCLHAQSSRKKQSKSNDLMTDHDRNTATYRNMARRAG